MSQPKGYKTKISKRLTWILRHGAEKVNIKLDKNGWADLAEILALKDFKGVKRQDILTIAAECPKQRFSIKEEGKTTYIKARQGHSIKDLDLNLDPIISEDALPCIYHGTYYRVWGNIKKNGLNRMNRVHIHFTPFFPKNAADCSGIRKSCQIIIQVNVGKLLAAGYKLWRSENNVILCEGNEKGVIPPSVFEKVIDRKTGQDILKSNI